MNYFGDDQVLPAPNADDAPFWESCTRHRLAFQCCVACGTFAHPPLSVCPRCQSFEREWVDAPSQATVFAFTWVHTAAHDAVRGRLPYNVVVVTFAGVPGVRLVSNVIDARPGLLAVGDVVHLQWEEIRGVALPRFTKACTGK